MTDFEAYGVIAKILLIMLGLGCTMHKAKGGDLPGDDRRRVLSLRLNLIAPAYLNWTRVGLAWCFTAR